MESLLNAQFDRIETALNTLIDSIATYNPSPAAAQDLLAIDDDLSRSLEQLSHHQHNHSLILSLRQTADTLTTQIKSTLSSLVDVRKELLALPSPSTPAHARDVPLHELLAYARRLAKFTVPPTYRPPPPQDDAAGMPQRKLVTATAATEDGKVANGVAASPAPAAGDETAAAAAAAAIKTETDDGPDARGAGWAALSSGRREWLETMRRTPFVPWPSESVIWSGALADVQRMVDVGRDPGSVLSAEQQEALERRMKVEEVERERGRREGEERRRERGVGEVGRGRGAVEREEEAGGLDLYDPDEE